MRAASSSRADRPRRAAGFTLLEVLAAVALLGLVYTVLGGAGIQGLQQEGEAERRFHASLLADRVLEGYESAFDLGAAPELGTQESSEGDFRIEARVTPYDQPVPELELPRELARGADRNRRPGESRREETALGPSVLTGTGGQPSPLRRVDVEVIWTEGWGERSVRRTTFGLDLEAASATLGALSSSAGAAAAGGGPR